MSLKPEGNRNYPARPPGSSPLTSTELCMPARELYDILIAEIHSFLSFILQELNIPNGVTILAWSLSTSVIMGLFTPEHLPKQNPTSPSSKESFSGIHQLTPFTANP